MRALAFPATLILAGVAPAGAQTFAEAVWANIAIAIQLCEARERRLQGYGQIAAWPQVFRAAGFVEKRIERLGTVPHVDTTYWFAAPADTVEVEVYHGGMPEHCSVRTGHQGVSATSQLLDGLIPQMFPGYVRHVTEGAPDPATGRSTICVRYEDPTNEIGHVVGVTSDAGDGCVEDGTSLVFSSYRV
jgi:hypothetical protein